MLMMKKDNVVRIVSPEKVAQFQELGFIICEDEGGFPLPPSAPTQDEKPEEKKVEPVEIVEEDNPLILSNGWYLSQVPETKPQLAKAFKELGIPYDYSWSRERFIQERDKWIKQFKEEKKRRKRSEP